MVNVEKLKKGAIFEVNTKMAVVSVIGTQFFVKSYQDKRSIIAVNQGKVYIKENYNKKEKILLHKDKSIAIDKKGYLIEDMDPQIRNRFDDFNKIKIKNDKLVSKIHLKVDSGPVILKLNDDKIAKFNKKIDFFVSHGIYSLHIENEEGKIYSEIINVKPNEDISKNIFFEKDKKKKVSKTWSSKEIYKYKYAKGQDKTNILGFAISPEYIITQTPTSILCFSQKGNIIWENFYGRKKELYFDSIPIIYKDKIYVSSMNKKILVLDISTGKRLKLIKTTGNMTFGYKIIPFGDKLYIPYPNGLYTLKINDNSFSSDPFITFNSPTTPLFLDNRIYISSFVENKVACYDFQSKFLWDFSMNQRSLNQIFYAKDSLFIGDNSGMIYKLSINGKFIKNVKMPEPVISNLCEWQNNIFVLVNDGYLYKIDINSLNVTKLFKVDNEPVASTYLFKSPTVIKNKLFIGTDKGDVIVYDIVKQKIENTIKLSDSSISSSVYCFGDYFFIGNEIGEVFLLEDR